jgi:hypothetical protein
VPPALVRSGIRAGVLVLILALPTLLLLKPTSAGFWLSAAAAGVAVLFIGALIVLMSLSHQSPPGKG